MHVKQGQVHGASAAVAGMPCDISLRDQDMLVHLRIEVRLHPGVLHVLGPAHEMIHGFLWAVGIIDFQAEAKIHRGGTCSFQCFRCIHGHERNRLFIPVDPVPDKIESGCVADFQDHIRQEIPDGHKARSIIGKLHSVKTSFTRRAEIPPGHPARCRSHIRKCPPACRVRSAGSSPGKWPCRRRWWARRYWHWRQE